MTHNVTREQIEKLMLALDRANNDSECAYLWDHINTICDLTENALASGWQTIDSAPKDGSDFISYVDGCRTLVHWGKVSHVPIYGWIDIVGDPEDRDLCYPTHWQPLPPPPSEE